MVKAAGLGTSIDREKALRVQMLNLGVRDGDLLESFVRSSGAGGQNVNKTATCVYLKHIPTGIQVKCQLERSQSLNRYLAREILFNKIETKIYNEHLKKRQENEKIKRQKRKRSQAARLRMLDEKRRRKQKKGFRAKLRPEAGEER